MQRYASLRQGLVGCWCPSVSGPFGYRLPDLSGYGNHGTLTNMDPGTDWVTSGGKGALDFDGTNDYVACNSFVNVKLSNISVCCWAKTTSNLQQRLPTKWDGTNGWILMFEANKLLTFYMKTTSLQTLQVSWSTSTFDNLVATFNGTVQKLYANGNLIASRNASGSEITNSNNALEFARSENNTQYLPGQLDDIRIYNRALSESEIRLLASGRGVGLIPERNARRYYQPPQQPRNRSSRFLSFPA